MICRKGSVLRASQNLSDIVWHYKNHEYKGSSWQFVIHCYTMLYKMKNLLYKCYTEKALFLWVLQRFVIHCYTDVIQCYTNVRRSVM